MTRNFFAWLRVSLEQLEKNLRAIGYAFKNPEGPIGFADPADLSLRHLERRYGQLPLAYQLLYETFNYIDFLQEDEQYLARGLEVSGLALHCPLKFVPLEEVETLRSTLAVHERIVGNKVFSFVPTGDWGSNCEPKGVWLPATEVDPVLYYEGWGPVTLMGQFADAIAAGGFPFWRHQFRKRKPSAEPLVGTPAYPKLLPLLVRGIQPAPPISIG